MKRKQNTSSWLIKKFLMLFAGLFVFANIFPIFTIALSDSHTSEFTQTAYAADGDTTTTGDTGNANTHSYADADSYGELLTANGGELKKKITEFSTLLVAFFTPIIAMAVKFAGVLMGDAYILGRAGDAAAEYPIAELLYELWDIVRTLVNYGFLLILLYVAVMNILPTKSDNFNLQSVLPSLIMGIIGVNMTWFVMTRVVFDVVDVATHIVYALPESIANKDSGVAKKLEKKDCVVNTISPENWDIKKNVPKANYKEENEESGKNAKKMPYTHGSCYAELVMINLNNQFRDVKSDEGKKSASAYASEIKDDKNGKKSNDKKFLEQLGNKQLTKVDYGVITIYWSDFEYERFSEGTILPLMAFSVMQIQNMPRMASDNVKNLTQVDEKTGKAIVSNNWGSLFVNTLVALILMIIVLILFVVMTITLIGRVIILWVNIIASPLMALQPLLEKVGINISGGSEYLGSGVFLKNAFAPVIMGVPFVIGFILIQVGQQYSIIGMAENGGMGSTGAFANGLASTHAMFYHLLTIGVLWAGGVKAMEFSANPFTSSIGKNITDGIEGFASWLKDAPMKIPLIPAGIDPETNKMQFASVNNFKDDKLRGWKNWLEEQDDELARKWGGQGPKSRTKSIFQNAGLDPEGSKAKDAVTAFKGLTINKDTFTTFVKNHSDLTKESDLVKQFIKENLNGIDRKLRRNLNTFEDIYAIKFEADTGKFITSSDGKLKVEEIIEPAMDMIYGREETTKTTKKTKTEIKKEVDAATKVIKEETKNITDITTKLKAEKVKLDTENKKTPPDATIVKNLTDKIKELKTKKDEAEKKKDDAQKIIDKHKTT